MHISGLGITLYYKTQKLAYYYTKLIHQTYLATSRMCHHGSKQIQKYILTMPLRAYVPLKRSVCKNGYGHCTFLPRIIIISRQVVVNVLIAILQLRRWQTECDHL